MKSYSVFTSMGDNIKGKIYNLKIEQKSLEEKINDVNNIQNSISKFKMDISNQGSGINNIEVIEKYRDEIEGFINSYKDGLKELKYKIENQSYSRLEVNSKSYHKKINFIYLAGILSVLIFAYGIIKQIMPLIITSIPIFILLIRLYLKYSIELKNNEFIEKNNESIKVLKERINEYEEKLNFYINETNSKTYEEFINKLTQYDKYKSYKDSVTLVIKNKEEELNKYDMTSLKANYNRNKGVITSLYSVLSCESLDEVLEQVEHYEELKENINRYEYEVSSIKKEIDNINEQLVDKEDEIRKKVSIIGLENVEIVDLHVKLKEYKDKISKMNEIKNALENVEETYKVLLKDRNIDEIKDEMKQIISQEINYTYESEEEIDVETRRQSNELLKVEKEIKDLEHIIEKRYLGKRRKEGNSRNRRGYSNL